MCRAHILQSHDSSWFIMLHRSSFTSHNNHHHSSSIIHPNSCTASGFAEVCCTPSLKLFDSDTHQMCWTLGVCKGMSHANISYYCDKWCELYVERCAGKSGRLQLKLNFNLHQTMSRKQFARLDWRNLWESNGKSIKVLGLLLFWNVCMYFLGVYKWM